MTKKEMLSKIEEMEVEQDQEFLQAIQDTCKKFERQLIPVVNAFAAGEAPTIDLKIQRINPN